MRRRLLVFAMVAAFVGSAMFTVLSDAKPRCLRCKQDGCPQGFCYIDCEGCCYEDPNYQFPVCFR